MLILYVFFFFGRFMLPLVVFVLSYTLFVALIMLLTCFLRKCFCFRDLYVSVFVIFCDLCYQTCIHSCFHKLGGSRTLRNIITH